ncbi:MAG TPA: helix-turn-helix domain-containing protein [Polyangiaceae bacterium]|jgi:excisionase family DNA binding protein|nr:helix-turn-helix domain-containing protein [Polyangiaceae bacterium]
MPDTRTEEFLTASDVADLLHIAVPTVEKWSREGILPSVLLPGRRHRRYTRAAVLGILTPAVPKAAGT